MKSPRHISWQNFLQSIVVSGEQRVHRISGSPVIELFCDGVEGRLGIWLETDVVDAIPPDALRMASFTVRYCVRNGRNALEVATATTGLRKQFYYFAIAVADRVLLDGELALAAVLAELRFFTELLEVDPVLSIERQVGLLGELLFLERLANHDSARALDAWIGPQKEPHDFRVGDREFEVKTTTTAHRIHTIHGSEQLVPTKGCSLNLLSILLGPEGASTGFSLPEVAERLARIYEANPEDGARLISKIEACGLKRSDHHYYTRRFALRRPLALVPIGKGFPALTRSTISAAVGAVSVRIESVEYVVNVEGLETEEGDTRFRSLLPELN